MRLIAKTLLLLALLYGGGFFVFVAMMPKPSQFDIDEAMRPITDQDGTVGIVALTGGGGDRIKKALDLYTAGYGERVLISGTHPDVRKSDLVEHGDLSILECCVDLGPRALTTVGNAQESADWAKTNGYSGLIIVTHDYHLPRALLHIRDATPDLAVVGVPVQGNRVPATGWYKEPRAWRLMVGEYTKYLVSFIRTRL